MGEQLVALRDSGVLIVGSGNVVHNLRAMDRNAVDAGFDWAKRFNEQAIELTQTSPGDAASLMHRPDFGQVAPTPEHFLPFLYIAGFGARIGCPLDVLIDGYAYGSLSMTSFAVDLKCPEPTHEQGAPALGSDAPAVSTNKAASTITACQPQNTHAPTLPESE